MKIPFYGKTAVKMHMVYDFNEIEGYFNGNDRPTILFVNVKALKENKKILTGIESYYKQEEVRALEAKEKQKEIGSGVENGLKEEDGEDMDLQSVLEETEDNPECNIVYFETNDLTMAKRALNMSKLPCAYLIDKGDIIDCKLIRYPRGCLQ